MTENDFFVAIQGVMTSAQEAGVTVEVIFHWTLDAAEEWIEENPVLEAEEDDE
jgi:hypothetical protein